MRFILIQTKEKGLIEWEQQLVKAEGKLTAALREQEQYYIQLLDEVEKGVIAEISYVVCCMAGAIVSIIVEQHKGKAKAPRSRLKRVNRIHNHECTTC